MTTIHCSSNVGFPKFSLSKQINSINLNFTTKHLYITKITKNFHKNYEKL